MSFSETTLASYIVLLFLWTLLSRVIEKRPTITMSATSTPALPSSLPSTPSRRCMRGASVLVRYGALQRAAARFDVGLLIGRAAAGFMPRPAGGARGTPLRPSRARL